MAEKDNTEMVLLAGWSGLGFTPMVEQINSLEKQPVGGGPLEVKMQAKGNTSFVQYAPCAPPAEVLAATFEPGRLAVTADLMLQGTSIGFLIVVGQGRPPIQGYQAAAFGGPIQKARWTPQIKEAFKQAGAKVVI